MDFNQELLCTTTEVKVIDESIPVDNEKIMNIIRNMQFDGIEQPFTDKLNTIDC